LRVRNICRRSVAGRVVTGRYVLIDFETRSTVDLRRVGSWQYSVHKTTELVCAAYAIGDAPVALWRPDEPLPEVLRSAAADPDTVWIAHGVSFELAIWQHIATPKHGWPPVPLPPRWHCTLVECSSLALPASLKDVADVLALPHRKGDDRIMHQMSKPRAPRGNENPNGGPYWFGDSNDADDVARRETLFEYCRGDVECERDLWRWLSC
jgi:DNA polymerase